MKPLSELGERRIIEEIIKPYLTEPDPSIVLDDAAPLPQINPSSSIYVSVDQGPSKTFLETLGIGNRTDIGHFHVTMNASDIAAMGAKPMAMVLALSVPRNTTDTELIEYLDGVSEASALYDLPLIGGDLNEGSKWHTSITAFGSVDKTKALNRSNAKDGDRLYISDSLGKTLASYVDHSISGHAIPMQRPIACIAEAQQLAHETDCLCAMDISDGIFTTAKQISKLSNVGIQLQIDNLSIVKPQLLNKQNLVLWRDFVTTTGGDYNLMFTSPNNRNIPKSAIEIGYVTNAFKGIRVENRTAENAIESQGWEHFTNQKSVGELLLKFVAE